MFEQIWLPASFDAHVHLRDGSMMETVVPTIRQGGVNTVYVMPNLIPPITTVQQALDYRERLQKLEPKVTFLMSLYLHPTVTPETIIEAKKAGITGVKSYPAGVTTNSSSGVVDYESFYPVFAEMERQNMVLNLHGESPSTTGSGVTVLNAEERFLPTLLDLHQRFPDLRIILEHCTTAAAIEAVKKCGSKVSATITAHHLYLIVDDWAGDPFCFCKPVAKTPQDRIALLKAVVSGNPKFFLGTDSAPHAILSKTCGADRKAKVAAGVFTQPYATQYALGALEKAVEEGILQESEVTEKVLRNFLGVFGRSFYAILPLASDERIKLTKGEDVVVDVLRHDKGEVEVVPFRSGQKTWSLTWV